MTKYQYYGLFIGECTKQYLIKTVKKNMFFKTFVPNMKDVKIYLDHITLMHVSNRDADLEFVFDANLGRLYRIIIDGIGFSDTAVAFKVRREDTSIVECCMNNTPHITIATYNNGKPVDSNNITNWFDIKPMMLTCRLEKR